MVRCLKIIGRPTTDGSCFALSCSIVHIKLLIELAVKADIQLLHSRRQLDPLLHWAEVTCMPSVLHVKQGLPAGQGHNLNVACWLAAGCRTTTLAAQEGRYYRQQPGNNHAVPQVACHFVGRARLNGILLYYRCKLCQLQARFRAVLC